MLLLNVESISISTWVPPLENIDIVKFSIHHKYQYTVGLSNITTDILKKD